MSGFRKGIDVSEYNGVVDWEKVKASGAGFAMIRAGFGRTLDRYFQRNVEQCNRVGLPCGVYWFSYALDTAGAAREAAACLDAIRPYAIGLPVGFDLEYDSVKYAQRHGVYIGKALASDMVRAYCRAIRSAGYPAMNYANPDFLNRYFDEGVKQEFLIWLAQWPGGTPQLETPPRTCEFWQYSAKGSVPGITGPVDLDVCYGDYPKEEETDDMTGEQIFNALNTYLDTLPVPEWAVEELAGAKAAGITDGKKPMRLIPRYQAAIMALRAETGGAPAQQDGGAITEQPEEVEETPDTALLDSAT